MTGRDTTNWFVALRFWEWGVTVRSVTLEWYGLVWRVG